MTVKLIYPAFLCGRPHVAEATVECRLTPRQIVIGEVCQPQIRYVNGHRHGPTGIGPRRYWLRNGQEVGWGDSLRHRSWRLADGELERLNDEARKAGR